MSLGSSGVSAGPHCAAEPGGEEGRRGNSGSRAGRSGSSRPPPAPAAIPSRRLGGVRSPVGHTDGVSARTWESFIILASELRPAMPMGRNSHLPWSEGWAGAVTLPFSMGGGVPGWDSQPGWTAEDSAQPCHGHAERPRWSKKPFSCLASAFDAPVQLVATGDPQAEPWPGRQQGQGQDKPIPRAEPLAAAGGRRRGLSPSFNSCPQWLRGSRGDLPVCARCWGQRGGSVAVPAAGLLLSEGLRVPSAAAGPHGRYCSMTDAAVSKNPEKKKGRKSEPLPRKPGGSHLLCRVLTKPGSPAAPDWGRPGDKRTGWKPRAVISPESLQPPTAVSAPF